MSVAFSLDRHTVSSVNGYEALKCIKNSLTSQLNKRKWDLQQKNVSSVVIDSSSMPIINIILDNLSRIFNVKVLSI